MTPVSPRRRDSEMEMARRDIDVAFGDVLALPRRVGRQTGDALDVAGDHFGEFGRDVQDDEDGDLLDRRNQTFQDDRQGLRTTGRGADDDDARTRLG